MLNFLRLNFLITLNFVIADEDLAGDHLLAEAKFPLKKILPQMQKKFQVALERPDLKVKHVGMTKSQSYKRNTVKLGYNDHGYNEFTAITNKIN